MQCFKCLWITVRATFASNSAHDPADVERQRIERRGRVRLDLIAGGGLAGLGRVESQAVHRPAFEMKQIRQIQAIVDHGRRFFQVAIAEDDRRGGILSRLTGEQMGQVSTCLIQSTCNWKGNSPSIPCRPVGRHEKRVLGKTIGLRPAALGNHEGGPRPHSMCIMIAFSAASKTDMS